MIALQKLWYDGLNIKPSISEVANDLVQQTTNDLHEIKNK